MRLISWNVNGIRAVMKKDFLASFETMKADVLCLQETKAQDDQVLETVAHIEHVNVYSSSAIKKGYAGTALFSKTKPLKIRNGLGDEEHDQEGRVLSAEYNDFILVNVYTPNSGRDLKRLDYRQHWDAAFLKYLKKLEKKKPLIICGDLNVAHQEIDIARPKANYNKTAGYMQEEIDGMDRLLNAGFVDTFRHKHPKTVKYSWWSMRAGARERNVGWRIDYFLVSESILKHVKKVDILNDIHGSDHCPVVLEVGLK